jgi:hypothetical protein
VTSLAAIRVPAEVLSHWGVLQQELVGCLIDARIDASLVSNTAPRSRMVHSDRWMIKFRSRRVHFGVWRTERPGVGGPPGARTLNLRIKSPQLYH